MDIENKCCPYLKTVKCGDTKEHRHFGCTQKILINKGLYPLSSLMDNMWVKVWCMSDNSKGCKYYPTG